MVSNMQEYALHEKVRAYLTKIPFVKIKCYEYKIGNGVGDFLLENVKTKSLSVVEVKYIDLYSTGKTARVRRNQQRNKVRKQAFQYGNYVHEKYPERRLNIFIYTNETGFLKLGVIQSTYK